MDLMFKILPFNYTQPPKLLFCLSSFITLDVETVQKTVADIWSHEVNKYHIDDTFLMCKFPDDELIYKASFSTSLQHLHN
ncbi:hypothetical protein EDB19DRAFT_1915243 [Suillus lakei]|nr:hypothetical protein EDB19DRAFT_1915243 [Suillus lakei]